MLLAFPEVFSALPYLLRQFGATIPFCQSYFAGGSKRQPCLAALFLGPGRTEMLMILRSNLKNSA